MVIFDASLKIALINKITICAVLILLSLLKIYKFMINNTTVWLNISSHGQIIFFEEKNTACLEAELATTQRGNPVKLLPNSTIWSCLLLLRLQYGNGRIISLPILPDSVTPAAFKSLAIACKWISANHKDNKLE